MPDRPAVYVHLLPSLIPPDALRGGVAVVVDVLRATTVMVQALAAGAEAVIPCLEIEEARAVASNLGPGRALLGGERHALPIPGFDLGNSPSAYTPEVCDGKTLVMTTTNGTRAVLACGEADRLLVASFGNRFATCRALKAIGQPVHLVCSGTDGAVSFEDLLLAGSIVRRLALLGLDHGNDEAVVARELYDPVENAQAEIDRTEATDDQYAGVLAMAIGRWRGGRRLRELALFRDVYFAAREDFADFSAELIRESTRIVRA